MLQLKVKTDMFTVWFWTFFNPVWIFQHVKKEKEKEKYAILCKMFVHELQKKTRFRKGNNPASAPIQETVVVLF